MVSAPDHQTLVTHLFDSGSEYLDSDTVFGVEESLVIDIRHTGDVDEPLRADFDVVLAVSDQAQLNGMDNGRKAVGGTE